MKAVCKGECMWVPISTGRHPEGTWRGRIISMVVCSNCLTYFIMISDYAKRSFTSEVGFFKDYYVKSVFMERGGSIIIKDGKPNKVSHTIRDNKIQVDQVVYY